MDHFLISCCANNYFPIVDLFLKYKPEACKNILHYACWWNQLPIVYSIILNDSTTINNTLTTSQITSLSLWLLRYSKEVVTSSPFAAISDILLRHGADPNIKDSLGNVSLHYACAYDFGPVYALSTDDSRTCVNKRGWTPKDCVAARMDTYVFSEVFARTPPEIYSDASDLGLHTVESLKTPVARPYKPSISDCKHKWNELHAENKMSDLFWIVLDSNYHEFKNAVNTYPDFIDEFTKYTNDYSCLQVACLKNDKHLLDIVKTSVFRDLSSVVKIKNFTITHFALMFGDTLLVKKFIQYGVVCFKDYIEELHNITEYMNQDKVTECFRIIKQSLDYSDIIVNKFLLSSYKIIRGKYIFGLLHDKQDYEYVKNTIEYQNTFILLLCDSY